MVLNNLLSMRALILGALIVATGMEANGAEKKQIPCDPLKAKKYLGKKKLTEMLQKLIPVWKPPKYQGAVCYFMAPAETKTVEFYCVHCKQKTVYPRKDLKDLQRMHRIVERLRGKLDLDLDDRIYCGHCNPEKKITALYLTVRLHDVCEEIRSTVTVNQMEAILALVNGDRRVKVDSPHKKTESIIYYIGDLKEILGIE